MKTIEERVDELERDNKQMTETFKAMSQCMKELNDKLQFLDPMELYKKKIEINLRLREEQDRGDV